MPNRPTYGAVSVGTTATLIIADNCNRKEIIITNASDDTVVYIGMDDQVTAATGTPFYENQTRGGSKDFGWWAGPIYGITASGSADVRFWETV